MTKTRKCLAFVIAMVMAFTLICIPGQAFEGPDYDKKAVYGVDNYVAFGDSVASGMNNDVRPLYEQAFDADGNPVLDAEGNPTYVEILGSTDYGYVGRVAERLGLDLHGNGAVSYAHTGMRVKDDWYSNYMNSIVTTEQFLRELYQADDSVKVHETVNRYMKSE